MITVNEIVAIVGLALDVEPARIVGPDRSRPVTEARHVAMFLTRKHVGLGSQAVADAIGQGDHSTVLYAYGRVEKQIGADKRFAQLVQTLSNTIDFRVGMAAGQDFDVLGIARAIVVNPRRAGISASLYEITAMASVLVDLWDLAETAEAYVAAIASPITDGVQEDQREELVAALGAAITDQLAALRGDANTAKQETDNAE